MTPEQLASTERPTPECSSCGRELVRSVAGDVCPACLYDAAMRTHDGERVGPYELLQPPLDVGGSGIVHIARQDDHDGLIAVKIARADQCDSPESLLAFRNDPHLIFDQRTSGTRSFNERDQTIGRGRGFRHRYTRLGNL